MALLSSSPFFLKAPLRGEGCAARCLLAECLWSSCRQAGRTSWSRTLQAGCGVHPLPGGRQQLAQGARQTDGRLRLTASSTSKAAGSSTDQRCCLRERKSLAARRRRGRRKERLPGGKIALIRLFSKSAAARRGMRCALLTCEVPVELMTPNRSNKLVEDSAGRLRPTAAARMNGNSLLSKLDKRYGQEAGCSGAPARRRPGGRHGRRSLGHAPQR